jgi:hypothetical protein
LLILGLGVLLITYVPDMSLGILKVMGKRGPDSTMVGP